MSVNLRPGFRFYPTEEELVTFYLRQKNEGGRLDLDRVIPVVDIYAYHPSELPRLSGELCQKDSQQQEWFFFVPRQEREVRGGRPNRLTQNGYWKATGSPGNVFSSRDSKIVGEKRTMVFYTGRVRDSKKTEWKMNEYTTIDLHGDDHQGSSSTVDVGLPGTESRTRTEYCICRVYKKAKYLRSFDRRPSSSLPLPSSSSSSLAAVPMTKSRSWEQQTFHDHVDYHHDQQYRHQQMDMIGRHPISDYAYDHQHEDHHLEQQMTMISLHPISNHDGHHLEQQTAMISRHPISNHIDNHQHDGHHLEQQTAIISYHPISNHVDNHQHDGHHLEQQTVMISYHPISNHVDNHQYDGHHLEQQTAMISRHPISNHIDNHQHDSYHSEQQMAMISHHTILNHVDDHQHDNHHLENGTIIASHHHASTPGEVDYAIANPTVQYHNDHRIHDIDMGMDVDVDWNVFDFFQI